MDEKFFSLSQQVIFAPITPLLTLVLTAMKHERMRFRLAELL
jgi:hypothetical protein